MARRKDELRAMAQHPNSLANLRTGEALKHGAHSSIPLRLAQAKAAEIAAVVPVRGEDGGPHPADAYAVERLAEVLCRIDLATAHLDAHGLVNKKGEAHSLLRHISRWEAQAQQWMESLGLTPKARVALGLGIAQTESLVKQWAREATPRGTVDGTARDKR